MSLHLKSGVWYLYKKKAYKSLFNQTIDNDYFKFYYVENENGIKYNDIGIQTARSELMEIKEVKELTSETHPEYYL